MQTLPCWGCGLQLEVPQTNAKIFSCPKCGAFNDSPPSLDSKYLYETASWKKKLRKLGKYMLPFGSVVCVPFVTFMMFYVISVGVGFVLPRIFEQWSFGFILSQLLAIFLGFNTIINYQLCLITLIPQAPANSSSLTNLSNSDPKNNNNNLSGYRFCWKCNRIKPPRSHHCSTCGKCVPLLDHHCIFTAGCIGEHNHKYFLLFLGWLFISVIYAFIVSMIVLLSTDVVKTTYSFLIEHIEFIIHKSLVVSNEPRASRSHLSSDWIIGVFIILEALICLITMIGVGVLFFSQLSLIQKGITSFESDFGILHRPPDHNSLTDNLKSILGPNKWLWPFPFLQSTFSSFFDQRKAK